jgi:hypothetical protein
MDTGMLDRNGRKCVYSPGFISLYYTHRFAMQRLVNVNPTSEHSVFLRLIVSNGPGC